ncbi:MAG: addiction module protein [Planctomycetota bacterium]
MGIPKIDWNRLTDAERLELLDQAWESFRAAPDTLPLSQALRDELARRQAAYDAGKMSVRTWDEVREGIRARLRHTP